MRIAEILQAIALMDGFRGLDRDIEGSAKRWKKWVDSECPEKEKLPQEWKSKSSFQKLIILRALRPDRMTYALRYIFWHCITLYTSFYPTLPLRRSVQAYSTPSLPFYLHNSSVRQVRLREEGRAQSYSASFTEKRKFEPRAL